MNALNETFTAQIGTLLHGEARQERDDKARRNLAAIALEQPNPAEWLAEMLDILGLRTGGAA